MCIAEDNRELRAREKPLKPFQANPIRSRDRIHRIRSREDVVILECHLQSVQWPELIDEEEEEARNKHQVQEGVSFEVFDEMSYLLLRT